MKKIILLLFSFYASSLPAQVITVRQDGLGDYTTIQQGIDAAAGNDTVLVYPGTYQENIDFSGKNITVCSLNLMTDDPAYIHQTVIDGNSLGSCVKLMSGETNALLHGFTLINGSGTYLGGGYYYGGGIRIQDSNAAVSNCIIKHNRVNGWGGGMACFNANVRLSNVTISNNHAFRGGGGIVISGTGSLVFDTIALCNIYLNYSSCACDIYKGYGYPPLHVVVDTFTVLTPDVHHLFSYLDYGYPQFDITWEIQHGKVEAVNDDLFVSPDGDNNNSGLTPEQPLKNICFALTKIISDSTHLNTIYLANGVYSTFTTNEKFPLNLRSYVSFSGQSRDSTILDANGIIFLLHGNKLTERYSIKSLTLQHGDGNKNTSLCIGTGAIINNYNVVFEDVKVTECTGTVVSGLHINTPNNILLKDMVFNNNRGGAALRIVLGLDPGLPPLPDTAWLINSHVNSNIPDYDTTDTAFGGGMAILGLLGYTSHLTCFIMNSEFVENINNAPPYGKSGCSLAVTFASEAYAINCTFGNNTTSNPMGAGIGITYNSTLNIYNSILYGNFPAELYLASDPDQICSLNIYHSLIAGGEEGIRVYGSQHQVHYDRTNIDTDPLWDSAGLYPYALTAFSPCIDAGTPNLPNGITLPDLDLAGNPRIWGEGIDMGAYEFGPWVNIQNPENDPYPTQANFLKISPNPFDYYTYINYETIEKGDLVIGIYDIYGHQLSKVIHTIQQPGKGKIFWDGTDRYNNTLPPGTYIAKLIIKGEEKGTIKMIKSK